MSQLRPGIVLCPNAEDTAVTANQQRRRLERGLKEWETEARNMDPIAADLPKLQRLLNNGYKLHTIRVTLPFPEVIRTTILLQGREGDLLLESDDREVFKFCNKQKVSCDENGEPAFRAVVDTTKHYLEAMALGWESEAMMKAAFQRLKAGQMRLDFRPEALIADFLESRQWGDARFVRLRSRYYDIFAFITVSGQKATNSAKELQRHYPESTRYAARIEELLRKAFDPLTDSVKASRACWPALRRHASSLSGL